MIKHTKNLLTQSLKIIFSASMIYWLISSGKLNFSSLKQMLSPANISIALILVALNIYFASERWRLLVNSQNMKTESWLLMKLSLIGSFFNYAMPGGVGGDVIKAYYFTKQNSGKKVVAITSVLMDRIMGLFSMIVMALVVMIYDFQHINQVPALYTLFWLILGLFSGFSIALLLIFSQTLYEKQFLIKIIKKLPLSGKITTAYESIHLYGQSGTRLICVVSLSLLSQVSAILFLYLVGQRTGYSEVPLTTYFLVAPLGFMATAIPISPAGVGVGQAAFYFLFNSHLGKTTNLGSTIITAFQVGTFIVSILGALFYLGFKESADLSKAEVF
jgi:hypothetical protein